MREPSLRQLKLGQELKKVAQDFFQRESTKSSLITVTEAEISPDLKNATFKISVLPEKYEIDAVNFARKKRQDLRTAIKNNLQIRTIPHVEIEIDKGERARQKIDSILFTEKHRQVNTLDEGFNNSLPVIDEEVIRTAGNINEDKLASEMD